jgi:hypothetical protein
MVSEQENQETVKPDELDSDQAALDGEQGQEPAAPEYVTADQLKDMFGTFQQELLSTNNMMRGLQGKQDTALNAIRRDSMAAVQQQEAQAQRQAQEQVLSQIEDPGMKAAMQALLQSQQAQLDAVRAQQAQGVQQQVATAADPMEEVYQFVESMGLARNNPNINYAVLQNQSLTDAQRRMEFGKSLQSAQGAASPPPAGQQQPGQRAGRTPSPPVEAGAASGSSYRAPEDVLDAINTGKITIDKGQELLTNMNAQEYLPRR